MSEVLNYLTFNKGIITEGNPLSFPADASIDELNCVLYKDGSRHRRLGLDLENNAIWNTVTGAEGFRWTVMEWDSAGGLSDVRFIVVQAGNRLFFFDGTGKSFSSSLKHIYTFPSPSPISTNLRVEGVSVMGDLVVTSAGLPIVFKYDAVTDTISNDYIALTIRDVFGVDDGLAIDENPGPPLSKEHEYNLLNQGWSKRVDGATVVNNGDDIYAGAGGTVYRPIQQQLTSDKIVEYGFSTSRYPDNTQVWWAGKDANDNFSPPHLDNIDFGTTAASKGRVLLDAFNRGDSRKGVFPSGTSLPADQELGRPTTITFAFQRVWYSGIKGQAVNTDDNSPVMTGFVFFSRTLRNRYDLGKCYTEADPCSEYDADIVDTDGGFINIPDSGLIYNLINIADTVLVLAQFGVWSIVGGDNGFTASNFSVNKVTSFGVFNPEATVLASDGVFYWGEGGIFLLNQGQGGAWVTTNITDDTIESLLDSIPEETRPYIVGGYDALNRRASWLINTQQKQTGFSETFDKELILDIGLGAFYVYSFIPDVDGTFISGYATSKVFLDVPEQYKGRINTTQKYLVVNTDTSGQFSFTFAYLRNQAFTDFPTLGNYNYKSYLITGYEVATLPSNKKYAPYVVCHFRRTETAIVNGEFNYPSGCTVQSRWDWLGAPSSGKWSTPQNAYRLLRYSATLEDGPFDYGFDVITTKPRLGGSGKALSLKFESVDGKDFHLYGWSVSVTSNPSIG